MVGTGFIFKSGFIWSLKIKTGFKPDIINPVSFGQSGYNKSGYLRSIQITFNPKPTNKEKRNVINVSLKKTSDN